MTNVIWVAFFGLVEILSLLANDDYVW